METTCGGSSMSENKTQTDGGPAFPIKGPVMTSDEQGMSLRDYLAAKAMQALAQKGNYFDATAKQAYMIADAMLKARDR